MLFTANMPRGKQWLVRARLWQLILSQHKDGHWEGRDLAFALQAHHEEDAAEGDACPLTCDADEVEATLPPALEAEVEKAKKLRRVAPPLRRQSSPPQRSPPQPHAAAATPQWRAATAPCSSTWRAGAR